SQIQVFWPFGQDSPSERREDVCFVDVVAFGRQAENAREYLRKGRAALIEGRLQWRRWERQDGQKRGKAEGMGDRIRFKPRGREEGMERPSPGPSRAGRRAICLRSRMMIFPFEE